METGKPKLTFRAKRPGVCVACAGPISVGEEITWNRAAKGSYYHATDECSPAAKVRGLNPDTPGAVVPDVMDDPDESIPDPPDDTATAVKAALAVIARAVSAPKVPAAPRVDPVVAETLQIHEDVIRGLGARIGTMESRPAVDMKGIADAANAALKANHDAILEDATAAATKIAHDSAAFVESKIKDIGVLRIELTRSNGERVEIPGTFHECYEQTLAYASEGRNVYLWGPPGSGKSHISRQIAEALGRSWTYDSLVPETFESALVGFYSATGSYVSANFRRAYEGGWVHCLDELDNSSARLQAKLNSALANGHGSFPDGTIKRHPDFVLVATGNTRGRGGDPVFPERRRMDPAFLDRFLPIFVGYDESLERKIAGATADARKPGSRPLGEAWAKYIQAVRKYASAKHPQIIISPRSSYDGALLLAAGRDIAEVSAACLYRTWDESACSDIRSNVKPFVSKS